MRVELAINGGPSTVTVAADDVFDWSIVTLEMLTEDWGIYEQVVAFSHYNHHDGVLKPPELK